MSATLGVAMDLNTTNLSQYSGYDFNSMCTLNGRPMAANENGLYFLDEGDTDAGVEIDAHFETVTSDFGSSAIKHIRAAHVGYEVDGELLLIFTPDDGDEAEYTLPTRTQGLRQSGNLLFCRSDARGRYWKLRIENVAGCDFSVDAVDLVLIVLGRRA